jgi:hypothetical protein
LGDPLPDDVPAGDHHQHGGEAVEQDEEQRNAVDSQVVVDVESLDPRLELDELEVARRVVEAGVERQRDGKSQHGPGQRDIAGGARVAVRARQEHRDAGDDRYPDRQAQERESGRYAHPMNAIVSSTRMPMIIANA